MDPIAHTFAGAALASAGLRRASPLAAATLVLAANAPDVDIVTQLGGSYASLAHRRGWTHGVLALAVWPFVLTGIIMLWDRLFRRRERRAAPIRPRAILALAVLGVLTHPALDWLNTYGMRWLMPFDGRWFYGDTLFIVDPWVWLILGGALFLRHSTRPLTLLAWSLFGIAATLLVLLTPVVPTMSRVVWLAGMGTFVGLRMRTPWSGADPERAPSPEMPARMAIAATAVYIVLMIAADDLAERDVRRLLLSGGEPAGDVMVGPLPANPFAGTVVAEVPGGYRFGDFQWFRSPRVRLHEELFERSISGPVVAAAAQHPSARDFLVWSRFPYARIEELGDGFEVLIGDARAPAGMGRGPLAGVRVRLHNDLRIARDTSLPVP